MLSLEREVLELRGAGAISDREAARLVALERREIFSIHPELRLLLYASVAMITGGVGVYLTRNLDRIGPATIVLVLFAAAATCYGSVILRTHRRRGKDEESHTLFDDYLLILGALLLSAAVGYFENQYHVLDEHWKHHLLLLAVFHALTAYFFDSRALLPLAIASLAGWFGITSNSSWMHPASDATGLRVLGCAAVVLVWRIANRVLGWKPHFGWVLEHFAANLALFGALLLVFDQPFEMVGLIVLIALGAFVVWWGIGKGESLFVIYGVVYMLVGIDVSVIRRLDEEILIFLYLLTSTVAAIVLLYRIRRTMVNA